ncbi:hypothetical protein TCAL_07721 [Tigriopus californicus]|uniref:Uncharacterized protein n=1 Tax=Tigriopus californicus TaxID=6832 RepID=A0A553PJR1_TIGCA|nr:hypothetical protein TCAL_07721 [Tigriopus californicus]
MFINQTQGLSPDLLADDFFQSENATSPLPAGDVWATMAEMGSQSLIAAMPEHFADKIIEAIFSKIEIFFVRTFLVLLFYALSPLVKLLMFNVGLLSAFVPPIARMDEIEPPNEESTPTEIMAWQAYKAVQDVANFDPYQVVFG